MPMPRCLVGVAGPDSAACRADLQVAEPPLRRLVDRQVPRHDQVRVAREHDDRRVDAALLEQVDLVEETSGSTTQPAPITDCVPRDDAARHLTHLPRLAVDDNCVPGVGTALIAAHHIRLLGEQVDDLALAFVAPLRADHYGRGHFANSSAPGSRPRDRPNGKCRKERQEERRRWARDPASYDPEQVPGVDRIASAGAPGAGHRARPAPGSSR